MLRVVFAQVLRRRGRALAVMAAIIAAAVSFSLLTSVVATSQLRVQGTVKENFRAAYDVLVRPEDSRTSLEQTQQLVRQNFLSGIFGGISMRQYRQISAIPGVQVAAPVAMIGYELPSLSLTVNIKDLLNGDRQQVYRLQTTWTSDRGLSSYPEANYYMYVTRQHLDYRDDHALGAVRDPVTGHRVAVCTSFGEQVRRPTSAFDQSHFVGMSCFPAKGVPESQAGAGNRAGQIEVHFSYPYPILLAAVDPAQEAKLVGLDDALTSGRYLRESDRPRIRTMGKESQALEYREVPVLLANKTLADDQVRIQVQRLAVGEEWRVPGRLASRGGVQWVQSLPGATLRTIAYDDAELYSRLARRYSGRSTGGYVNYWSPGPVEYRTTPSGHLQPLPVRNAAGIWADPFGGAGFYAPQANGDVGFRRITGHQVSNDIVGNVTNFPVLHAVGYFDPDEIRGFSKLSQVPLTTYEPPEAAPGDAHTRELLGGRALLPNANLGGYLQQPPLMLTTLKSLGVFTDSQNFTAINGRTGLAQFGLHARKPLSVIRVRVAGVTGPDDLSRERVRVVAEQIARRTGLDVDVTIGSSPTQQLIDLPAGQYGRPKLTLSEGWTLKGVSVLLLDAIDRKSLALFGLVLLVCLLFLINATLAALRSRRSELGVLSCLGWSRRHIFALLEAEVAALGVLAGLAGSAIAIVVVNVAGLHNSWLALALITPVATALAALAGLGPAWSACRTTPLESIHASVRPPRRASKVTTIRRLALVGVTRWPGRTLLAATSLFIGVAALAALIAINDAFHGQVIGTALGDTVAVEVRGVDYFAAAITLALGGFAIADIAYLNINERAAEIGTLTSTGWSASQLRRLFAIEAITTAALGALVGAAVGIGATAILLPIGIGPGLIGAAGAAGTGLLVASLALLAPLATISRLQPAATLTSE